MKEAIENIGMMIMTEEVLNIDLGGVMMIEEVINTGADIDHEAEVNLHRPVEVIIIIIIEEADPGAILEKPDDIDDTPEITEVDLIPETEKRIHTKVNRTMKNIKAERKIVAKVNRRTHK